MSRHVLVVLHEDVLGGATLAITRVAPHLAERGWTLSFWVGDPSPAATELREMGYRVHPAPRVSGAWPNPLVYSVRALRLDPGMRARLRLAPLYARQLRRTVAASRPALVHANSTLSLWEAMIAKRSGVPVLLHVHESLSPAVRDRLAARLAARMDRVVVPSKATARALRDVGVETVLAPNGIALTPAVAPGPARQSPLIVTVGSISRRKGSDLFVDAADLVHERRPDLRFEMAGNADAPFEREWARLVIDRARRARVSWSPHIDVQAARENWGVFVLPSRADPFPNVVLEAMAAGVPVIGSDVDGIPEQLGRDGGGLLVPPEDPRALAEAVLDLAASPERRMEVGRSGRRRVGELFSLDQQADALHRVYCEIADGSG